MNETVSQGVHAAASTVNQARQGIALRAAASMLLGALIIYGVGFAPGILHGQSHDSRHTLGFVCH